MSYYHEHTVLFELGDWILQKDILFGGYPIASIRHQCSRDKPQYSNTIWFNGKNGKYGITSCYCGEKVPDEIQGLCCLYNMEWLGQRKDT